MDFRFHIFEKRSNKKNDVISFFQDSAASTSFDEPLSNNEVENSTSDFRNQTIEPSTENLIDNYSTDDEDGFEVISFEAPPESTLYFKGRYSSEKKDKKARIISFQLRISTN